MVWSQEHSLSTWQKTVKLSGCLKSIFCFIFLEDFFIASAFRVSCKHLLQPEKPRAKALWKERWGCFRHRRHLRGIHCVFQRRTKNNLWHFSLIQPATFFSSASFLLCSLFAVGLQVKRLTSPGQTLTRWASPWAHKDQATFSILSYPSYTLSLCFQLRLPSQLLSLFSPLGIPISPSLRSLFPSFPHCPAVSILAWLIDFCKGWLRLPPSFLSNSLFFLLLLFYLSPSSSLLSLPLFFSIKLHILLLSVLLFFSCSFHSSQSLYRLNFRLKLSFLSLYLYVWSFVTYFYPTVPWTSLTVCWCQLNNTEQSIWSVFLKSPIAQ